jgi:dihydrolipoamide dehydrogenase
VALVENKELGGTCLNRGCIPSKALIAGAEAYQRVQNIHELGIEFPQASVRFDLLAKHKDQTVNRMRKGVEGLVAANKITFFKGFGQFISPREIKVKGEDISFLEAPHIIIATGSEPRNIPAFPFDYKKIHDSTSLLELNALPSSIVIIGGGVIGCEFASLYAILGVKVTLLELMPRLLPMEAQEVSQALTKAFSKKGIHIETGVKVQSIDTSGSGVVVEVEGGRSFAADIALVAVGRTLNTANIGLEKAGLAPLGNGMIAVDERMETEVKGIYAVGDIASKWWLAHVATHQGLVAADNICGYSSHMSYQAIPSVIFTHPEIATVGLSIEQALNQGYKAKVAAFPFQALGKAQAMLETEGFAQIVVDEKIGQILGAQAVGYEASTLISEMALAITNELTVECLNETIHPHPTFGEAWLQAGLLATGFPVDMLPKGKKERKGNDKQ